MNQLKKQLSELESYSDKLDFQNTAISQSTIGWQIDHTLKVVIGIVSVMQSSNPDDYKWKFNKYRTIVFWKNKIPRGKVKAPKSVQTYEIITPKDLASQFETSKIQIENFELLNQNSNFKHPFLGQLNIKLAVKFLQIHTEHHLQIIRDILK